MNPSEIELCGVCGGDGTITNAWGQKNRCPSCHGNGKRRVDTGFHDVTKTKPSHHGPTNRAGGAVKDNKPSTPLGQLLMAEVEKTTLSAEAKAKLVLEIYEHEASHGQVTKTFAKKLRKSAGVKAG